MPHFAFCLQLPDPVVEFDGVLALGRLVIQRVPVHITPQEEDQGVVREVMTADDLEATADLPDKIRTTLAFNHVMQKYSHESALVMTNLPVPKDEDTTDEYMEHLAVLMNNIPRALLVAGQKDADVITMYS